MSPRSPQRESQEGDDLVSVVLSYRGGDVRVIFDGEVQTLSLLPHGEMQMVGVQEVSEAGHRVSRLQEHVFWRIRMGHI